MRVSQLASCRGVFGLPDSIIVEGARIQLYYPVVLAVSDNFAVSAVFDKIEWSLPEKIKDLVARALKGEDISLPKDPITGVMVGSVLYGGVLLFHISGGEVIPLSRLLIKGGFRKIGHCETVSRISDESILYMWRSLYKGRVDEALESINKCTYSPSFKIEYNPVGEIAPIGYETIY